MSPDQCQVNLPRSSAPFPVTLLLRHAFITRLLLCCTYIVNSHVDNIYLLLKVTNLAAKMSCDITYEGGYYTISGVRYKTAGLSYIDSDDPSKTSGWMNIEPDDFNIFLTVPEDFVTGNGGQNTPKEKFYSDTADPPRNGNYTDWFEEQRSWWDHSFPTFNKLIKKNLNDEKSFKHIETQAAPATTISERDRLNNLLAEYGFSERLKLYDILVMTEFSAKNAFNATIKSSAIGIIRYSSGNAVLLSIG